nr:hypothetical protein pmam_237 [Pithovirus mammoth]
MEFLFFEGPTNVRELFPELVENSYLNYPEIVRENFVILNGERILVDFYKHVGWSAKEIAYTDSRREEILSRTSLSPSNPLSLPVQVEEVEKERIWRPVEELLEEDQWLALMVDDEVIVGFYFGEVFLDNLGRKYSTHSYLNIRPDYRGRGLCRPFAQFAYNNATRNLQVIYFCITVATSETAGVCRCYIRAALNLGYQTYGDFGEFYPEFEQIEVENCNSGKMKFLIFVTDGSPFDEEMEQSFSK